MSRDVPSGLTRDYSLGDRSLEGGEVVKKAEQIKQKILFLVSPEEQAMVSIYLDQLESWSKFCGQMIGIEKMCKTNQRTQDAVEGDLESLGF